MINGNSKISVVMAVYNGQKYVREAIESILNQTFRDFEFIIVDDGSIDTTSEILKEYAREDERIKIITNPKNIGLTKSLNKAIKVAQGKYIARMDADDISLPERLERQIEFMRKNPEVGLLGTAYYEMNLKGEIVGDKFFPTSDKKLKKILIKYNPFFHASVMIRKEILDKIGLYNENIPKAQDYDLWFRVTRSHKLANLDEPLMKRRYTKEMISIKKENEQIFWAQKARAGAIQRGQYSKWAYFYLLRPFLVLKIPIFWRKSLRKHLLRKKIYD